MCRDTGVNMIDDLIIHAILNDKERRFSVSATETLAELLKKEGTSQWIDEKCHGCTHNAFPIILDGKQVNANYILARYLDWAKIETLDGLLNNTSLSLLWRAFEKQNITKYDCCIPGAKVAMASLLRQNPNPTYEDIRLALSGNLCDCNSREKIEKAASNLFEIICRYQEKTRALENKKEARFAELW